MPTHPAGTDKVVGSLRSLGLTKYEAMVYTGLLQVTSATASEIHAITGVPRASVYPVLGQLQEKNLVSVSQTVPKRFAAVPPDDGIDRLMGAIERDARDARDTLSAVYSERLGDRAETGELIWNIHGIDNIQRRLVALISQAGSGVRIFAHSRLLSDNVQRALVDAAGHAGVEIITDQWQKGTSGRMNVFVIDHTGLSRKFRQAQEEISGGICIADDRRVLVIMGNGRDDVVALFSEAEGFVRFFTRYFSIIAELAKSPK